MSFSPCPNDSAEMEGEGVVRVSWMGGRSLGISLAHEQEIEESHCRCGFCGVCPEA